MSQQVLDTRRPVQAVRRHKILVVIVAAVGLLFGVAYAVVEPPMLSSTALILLPAAAPSVATEVIVAESDPVLSSALPSVSPRMSVTQLRKDLRIKSLSSYVISVTARGKTAADAEATANSVAQSFVTAVTPRYSLVGHVVARILEGASPATGASLLLSLLSTALIGLLAGALAGVIVALVISRNDRRLRERDEIANAIGLPVLASFPVLHPAAAADWTRLLEEYRPKVVDAWQMHSALKHLGVVGHTLGHPWYTGDGGPASLTILSLSSDPGALALGPQLAVFAASQGVPTALVVGSQQDTDATALLRTACTAPPGSSKRPDLLQVIESGSVSTPLPDRVLTVVVTVVDGQEPRIPETMRTTATVIGVSAGMATATQLAQAAVTAAVDGREITGIFVADPEAADRTNGRVPVPARRRSRIGSSGLTNEIRR
jgi:capsular polysaccharide biosynthesis protein